MIRRQGGFTLVEVLVSLFVLAIAVAAAVRLTSASADLSAQLRARLLADWVAQDRLETRRAMRDWLPTGSTEGTATQAGLEFRWREQITPTQVANFRRLEVVVYAAADSQTRLAQGVAILTASER